MSNDMQQKTQRVLERMAQTLHASKIGEWVMHRLETGQNVDLSALQAWVNDLCQSANIAEQKLGHSLSEWLSSLPNNENT